MMWNSFRLRIPKHNIINAWNIVGAHDTRNRFAGCGSFELFRRVRDDDIRFFPLAVFQELRIPHPDHFLDGEAFQLHGILADILRGLVVGDDIAVRNRPGNCPIDHDEFAFLQIHNSHDQLTGFGSQSEPVLHGGRLELFAGHAVTNHHTAEGCIHLGELLAGIGVDDHCGIADTVLQAFLDIEIHILDSTVLAAAPAVTGMDSTERLSLRIPVKDEVNLLIAVETVSYGIKPGIKKEPAHDQDANVNPSEAFIPERHLTLRQRMREFSRFHGLPKRDAVFFNESDLLVDMAKKEDFVILGRCGDAIMANNNIPHISIYITAPFEQRIKRAMEIDSSLTVKQARHMLKHLDHVHSQYYHYYTNRNWGHSNNYDLCINSASYGIDGTVDFIYRMITAREEDK